MFVGAAVALGLYLSLQPWRVYQQQKGIARAKETELRDVERRRVEDLKQEARFGGPLGTEELARTQGYRKPGEVPVTP